jgi:hypothetical protein
MGIADERRIAELRHRRSRNQLLFRTIGYVSSLIPAILIAFNFEAFRQYVITAFGGHVEQQVVTQPVATIEKPERPSPVARSTPPPTVRVANTVRPVPRERVVVQPVPIRRQPVRLLEPVQEVKPDYEITLDLSKRRQRFPVELEFETARLRVLPVELSHRPTMTPSDGSFDGQHPLTLAFSASFKPSITVSLDRVGENTVVSLEYRVESNAGQRNFTTTNLAVIRRKVVKSGQQAMAAVARLNAEQVRVKAYLSAPGGKLWNVKKQATLRDGELPALIADAKKQVATIEANLKATDELIELADSIDGAKLGLVVEDQRLTSD